MRRLILATLVIAASAVADAAEFAKPVRLDGGGEAVRVESPGYAAPCWADIDGDSHAWSVGGPNQAQAAGTSSHRARHLSISRMG